MISDLACDPFKRRSYRVEFEGGAGFRLAGIVDRPVVAADDAATDDAAPLPSNVPVVVFSHCFTCGKDIKAIARISRRMSELGVAVLRFDMTGLGGSQGDFSHTNFSTNLADLTAAIRFATQSLGPVTGLIGHSFGGAASLGVAAGLPHAVGEQLTVAEREAIRAVVAIAAPSDTQHLASLMEVMNPAIVTDGVGDVVIGGRTWTIRQETLDDFRSHQLADQLDQIRCPVMVFHSPVDQTLGFDHALRIAGLVHDQDGLSQASVIALPGADHLLISHPSDATFVAETAAVFLRRYQS